MENRDVKISDYEEEQHLLKICLNMVGINVDYITTDLIYRTMKKYQHLKGKMTIHDSVKIKYEHQIFWETYFRVKEELKNVENKQDYEWVKSKDAQKILKISSGTLTTLRKNGKIPFSKMGGTFLYKKEDIEKVLQENKIKK
jgi:hypothetical protein